jgi:hypothetical protein
MTMAQTLSFFRKLVSFNLKFPHEKRCLILILLSFADVAGYYASLAQKACGQAEAVYQTTYQDEKTAFWFNTPAIWYTCRPTFYRSQQNMRPRVVWELLLEIKNPFERPKMKELR